MNELTDQNISIAFSPCPNDTFMFDALIHSKINTGGINFNVHLEDIQTLNRHALEGEYDVSKISFAVYPLIEEKYELLTSGSALGNGVGPLLISKKEFSDPEKEIRTVAIPGKNTTAYFLFKLFYGGNFRIIEMNFSQIENALLNNEVDAGVIIHENRFTYQQRGLKKINDLGELWEKQTGQPIPLGGIVIRKSINKEIRIKINSMIRQSVEFAFADPKSSVEYVRQHAQEMSEEVRNKHISLYVNNFSADLGDSGKKAIEKFLQISDRSKKIIFTDEIN